MEASEVFKGLRVRDVVSWNSMISGHTQSGNNHTALLFFNSMQQAGVVPDVVTFSCALQACTGMKDRAQGQSIHKQLIESGVRIDSVVGTTLIDMYAKCGYLGDARKVFDGLENRNSILWGVMVDGYTMHGQYNSGIDLVKQMDHHGIKLDISSIPCILQTYAGIADLAGGCVQHDDGLNALILYERMQHKGFHSDKVTLVGVLKACTNIGSMIEGKKLHDEVCRSGLEMDVILGSILVDMYAKWGNLLDARVLFNTLTCQDIISCSSMIIGYIECENWLSALQMYELMQQKDIKSDNISFACVLKACSGLETVNVGRHVHDDIVRNALDKETMIGNALIDMYAKCGRLHEARHSFDTLASRNLTSWNAMMTGYMQYDDSFPALLLFQCLKEVGMSPDKVTFLCALKACTTAGSTDNGKLIHDEIIRHGLECDLVICNSIIDMYARYGNLMDAHKVFDGLPNRDVVSWTALISGYAQHGSFRKFEIYLNAMKKMGLKLTSKTFASILSACSHTGRVKECHKYFRSMKEDYGIIPSIEHCNCMIDILGRAGHLDDAFKFLQSLPILPNIKTWMTLLTSCRAFGRILFGKYCFDQLMKLDPNNASAFLIMSKIYADANRWDDVYKLEEACKGKGSWESPAKAWTEIDSEVHEFVVGGTNYQHLEVVFFKVKLSVRAMKENGYVPQSNTVLDGEVRELCVECQTVYYQSIHGRTLVLPITTQIHSLT